VAFNNNIGYDQNSFFLSKNLEGKNQRSLYEVSDVFVFDTASGKAFGDANKPEDLYAVK
jgi:hypothetical protein